MKLKRIIKIPFLKTSSEYCLLLSFQAKHFRWSSGPRMDTETTPAYWWTIPILFMSSFGEDPIICPLLIYFVPLINRLIGNTSTRLRQECPFFVLSTLVSKVVSDFWGGVSGQVLCTPIRGDGITSAGSLQDWQTLLCTRCKGKRWKGIVHEEKRKEHSVSFDKQ